MGMDVYGKNATSEAGKYFRRSVWSWHPLWSYCQAMAPAITAFVRYGHSNDGDGLGPDGAVELAIVLERTIMNGEALAYITARDAHLAALPLEPCEICAGTGKRLPPPNVGAGDQPCNGCESKGQRKSYQTYYPLDVDDVREFAAFLRDSGGFEIQ